MNAYDIILCIQCSNIIGTKYHLPSIAPLLATLFISSVLWTKSEFCSHLLFHCNVSLYNTHENSFCTYTYYDLLSKIFSNYVPLASNNLIILKVIVLYFLIIYFTLYISFFMYSYLLVSRFLLL